MFRSPHHRRPGRDARCVSGGRPARRPLTLEPLERRVVPVVGAHGLAPEVGRGGDLDGIVLVEQGSGYGTGALLADGRHILTAAHVVDGGGGKSITFQLARGQTEIDITINIPAGSVLLNSSWVNGGPANQGSDLALMTLVDQVQQQASRHLVAPFGAQRFGFWAGDVSGEVVTMVGYGRTGTGVDGNHLDEVQRVTANGQPGGTFRLTFQGQTTAPLDAGATAAQVQAALGALAGIGTNNVEVSDRGLPAGTWDVRFVRGLGNRDVELLTASGASVAEVFAGGNPEMTRVKREGRNVIDHVEGQFLSYDFDDGTDAHNTWGDTGLFWGESGMERGDSGSPLLVESAGAYSIAGVFSWIATGGEKDFNSYPTPDGSFGGTGTYVGTQAQQAGFLTSGMSGNYDLVLDMRQQVLGLDEVKERLTIRAYRDGGDLVLSVFGSSDWGLNGEYYRAPLNGPGGRILSLTLRGGDDDETFEIDGDLGLNSVTVDGRGGEDTLELDNSLRNLWKVTGPNAGTVSTNKVAFQAVEHLRGGTGQDTVSFASGGQVTGSVSGGGGYDDLDYSAYGGAVTTHALPIPYGGFDGPLGFGQPDYTFQGATTAVGALYYGFEAVRGGGASDTLDYDGGGSWWSLTGPNAGTVNGFAFSSMENLTGDRYEDRFVFGPGSSVAGRIDGGDSWDTLDYSGFGKPVTVDLASGVAPAVGSFTRIERLIGGSGSSDTLVGGPGNNTWTIIGPGQGDYNGLYGYLGFENLTGGAGRDQFVFGKDGWMAGVLSGGGGSDWLDYRGDGPASVDLGHRFATNTGGVVGIENVWGSLGGMSRLVGDALNNILIAFGSGNFVHGTAGRDLLVGGLGRNTVYGGLGDDVVIAGSTTFDNDAAALCALMAEWARNIGYYARVANLKSGGGLTGGLKLQYGTTLVAPPPILVKAGPTVGVKHSYSLLPQTMVYGSGGYDFFVVRFVAAAGDFDRVRERYV
ncbi:MAG: calcium-binding protein [Gemmataceae bacterium]